MAQKRVKSGFSSQSYSPSPYGSSPSVSTVNPELLNPPNINIDPQDQQAKTKEKDAMVGLNDKFVALIDKVRHLEQEKKVLEKRRERLLEQHGYKGKPEDVVKQMAADMRQKIDELARDRRKLQADLVKSNDDLADTRARIDDEAKRKTDLENDFILTKKDLDDGYLQRVNLELTLEDLNRQMNFLKHGYAEEIKELESLIYNETIIMKPENTQDLDMEQILQAHKAMYEDMAARGRLEAEQWNQRKMDVMLHKAERQEQDVMNTRREILDLQRSLQRLQSEIDMLNNKRKSLEDDIEKAEEDGQETVNAIRDQIVQVDEALRRDRKVLAKQTCDYQELLNLKLALDIEINTYKQILEGEEMRMTNRSNDHYDS